MGLIDIDDRDTYNIECDVCEFPETTELPDKVDPVTSKYKEWLGRLKAELPASCIVNHLGVGRYKIDLPVITCTGSDVTTIFNIPFMNQMQKMEIKHTDSSKADSNNLLDYSVSHRHHPNLWIILLDVGDSTASDIIDEYIDYHMARGEYKLISNSTNNELLYISVYIRITGD